MKIIRKIHQNLSGRQASDLDLNFKVIMVTKVTVKLILDFNREKNVYAIWKQLEQFTNNYHAYKFLDSSMSIHQFSKSQKFEKIWKNFNSRYFIQFWFWVCYILHLISFFLACLVTEKIVFFSKITTLFFKRWNNSKPLPCLDRVMSSRVKAYLYFVWFSSTSCE